MGAEASRARSGHQGPEKARRGRSEAGFDRWIVDQLRKLYDEVLDEEVPEDLVKVVRSFNGQQQSAPGADREQEEHERPASQRKPRRARG